MSEHKKEDGQENPSKEKSTETSLSEKAAKLLGWKIRKLPKNWTRVIFKR